MKIALLSFFIMFVLTTPALSQDTAEEHYKTSYMGMSAVAVKHLVDNQKFYYLKGRLEGCGMSDLSAKMESPSFDKSSFQDLSPERQGAVLAAMQLYIVGYVTGVSSTASLMLEGLDIQSRKAVCGQLASDAVQYLP